MSEDSKPKSKAFELYELRKEIMEIDYKLKLVEKNCSTLNINFDLCKDVYFDYHS